MYLPYVLRFWYTKKDQTTAGLAKNSTYTTSPSGAGKLSKLTFSSRDIWINNLI